MRRGRKDRRCALARQELFDLALRTEAELRVRGGEVAEGSQLVVEYYSRPATRMSNLRREKVEGIPLPVMARSRALTVDGQGVQLKRTKERLSTAREFYGLIISLFDPKGALRFQQCTSTALAPYCKATLPDALAKAGVSAGAAESDGPAPVRAEAAAIKPAEDGVLLKAADAQLTGHLKLEEGIYDGKTNIGFWRSLDDTVAWTAEIPRPGVFDVLVDYACDPQFGGQYAVIAGDQKITVTTVPTAGWGNFVTVKIGQFNFNRAGPVAITIKPVKNEHAALMNLRSVLLRPAP